MKKNVVCMIGLKEDENAPYPDFVQRCISSWETWCRKNNSEFFLWQSPAYPFKEVIPHFQKMLTIEVLEQNNIEYDQIAQIDYDIFALPHAKNFFELTDRKFSAVLDNGMGPALQLIVQIIRKEWFPNINTINWDTYFNSGFMVYNESHKEVFRKTYEFYEKNKNHPVFVDNDLNDQTILQFILKELNVEINYLPRSYNVLDWHLHNFFWNGKDHKGRTIDAKQNMIECCNLLHISGGLDFRNQATGWLFANFKEELGL